MRQRLLALFLLALLTACSFQPAPTSAPVTPAHIDFITSGILPGSKGDRQILPGSKGDRQILPGSKGDRQILPELRVQIRLPRAGTGFAVQSWHDWQAQVDGEQVNTRFESVLSHDGELILSFVLENVAIGREGYQELLFRSADQTVQVAAVVPVLAPEQSALAEPLSLETTAVWLLARDAQTAAGEPVQQVSAAELAQWQKKPEAKALIDALESLFVSGQGKMDQQVIEKLKTESKQNEVPASAAQAESQPSDAAQSNSQVTHGSGASGGGGGGSGNSGNGQSNQPENHSDSAQNNGSGPVENSGNGPSDNNGNGPAENNSHAAENNNQSSAENNGNDSAANKSRGKGADSAQDVGVGSETAQEQESAPEAPGPAASQRADAVQENAGQGPSPANPAPETPAPESQAPPVGDPPQTAPVPDSGNPPAPQEKGSDNAGKGKENKGSDNNGSDNNGQGGVNTSQDSEQNNAGSKKK